ncbi:MAG: DUF3482 domain-containing protein [Bdellovibrionia bacterium]
MRNYQRQIAITLITSIAMTSIASSRAWADIRLQDRSADVQVPVKRVETVMVPQQRVVTDIQSRQVRATDIVRDDSENYTCRAYAGMDHQVLQEKYNDLRFKHAETFAEKPVGSAAVGAVAGAALTVVTGGMALVGAAIGAAIGGLFSWFRGGKSEEQRDLAVRSRKAQFDEETLQLNCMENELKKSQIYAGTVPRDMPAGVRTSYESKAVVSNSGSGSSSSSYYEESRSNSSSSRSSSTGSASGEVNRVPSGCASGGCGDSMTESNYNSSSESYSQPAPAQVPVEDRSTTSGGSSVASCLY